MFDKLLKSNPKTMFSNPIIDKIQNGNDKAIARARQFQQDSRPRSVKFADFSHLKHRVPYLAWCHVGAGQIDFTLFHANDDIVAWEYFWFGANGYEEQIVNTWLNWSSCKNTVLDVGGYTGLMSILAALSHPRTTVHLLEPMERTIERAKINMKANCVADQTTLHAKAASNKAGTETIYMPRDADFLGTGNSIFDKGKTVDTHSIQCVRLDDELSDFSPSIVKIDVEGHELACLQGMEQMLTKHRPKMIIEVWEHTRAEVLKMLSNLGYGLTPFEAQERRVMNYRCIPQ